jgi:hypothetical protein
MPPLQLQMSQLEGGNDAIKGATLVLTNVSQESSALRDNIEQLATELNDWKGETSLTEVNLKQPSHPFFALLMTFHLSQSLQLSTHRPYKRPVLI